MADDPRKPRVLRVRAANVAEAMRRIQAELGPDARLQRLREVPAPGLARWWRRPSVEVEAVAAPRLPVAEGLEAAAGPAARWESSGGPARGRNDPAVAPVEREVGRLLEDLGMDPVVVQGLLAEALGPEPDPEASTREQLRRIASVMIRQWRQPVDPVTDPASGRRLPVVLLGAPGVGKTTVLAKWLAAEVAARRPAGPLWLLDGDRPNGATTLATHAELLQVPVERLRPAGPFPGEGGWIDVPGVGPGSEADRARLKEWLDTLGPTRRWLVVNACYDLVQLRRQIRFFAPLGCRGLVLTHLDEETRAARVWNLALSAAPPVAYASSGPSYSDPWRALTPEPLALALLEGVGPS